MKNRMEKWSFNMLLLSKLTDVMSLSCSEIARRCEVNQSALFHYIRGDYELPVQVLIQLCNGLRMPSLYFISVDGRHVIPNRETATIQADRWQMVEWNEKAVGKTFGNGKGLINWKDVAVVMGVSNYKPHERFLLHTRFPINSFLQTCTYYNISPYTFLVDTNSIPSLDVGKRRKLKEKKHSPPLSSYAEMSKKMDFLEQGIADLRKKYDDLLRKHEILERRVNSNIQSVRENIGDIGDLAAEERRKEE